jgi:hypothetical protein
MTLTVHDPGSSCTSGGGRLTWRNSGPDRARETGPLVDASRRVSNSTLFLRQRQTAGLRAQGLFACHWPKAGRCSEGRNATVVCCRSDSLEGGGCVGFGPCSTPAAPWFRTRFVQLTGGSSRWCPGYHPRDHPPGQVRHRARSEGQPRDWHSQNPARPPPSRLFSAFTFGMNA